MGNISQPMNPLGVGFNQRPTQPNCRAAIKSFQYGWGAINQGNRCIVTIVDELGGQFENWVKRIAKNVEGMSTPIAGAYRMVVQFGWYVEGGGDGDICGQPAGLPNKKPEDGENTSFIVCSPLLYFLPNMVTVNYEGNKFICDIEGMDLIIRSQESMIATRFSGDGSDPNDNSRSSQKMYFVEACQRLGLASQPPFRVEFWAFDDGGNPTRMNFVRRNGVPEDDACWGPFDVWSTTDERAPLAIIHEWIRTRAIRAVDLTGRTSSGELGIVLNYDPTYRFNTDGPDPSQCSAYKCPPPATCPPRDFVGPPLPGCNPVEFCDCIGNLPQYGRLIMWAASIPYCQGDGDPGAVAKAVYIVNGGKCSPVISFNPVFKWHFFAGMRAGAPQGPAVVGTMRKEQDALRETLCGITGGRNITRTESSAADATALRLNNADIQQGQAVFHQTMSNLMVYAIEAELRVQGDPSDWLCTPALGYGRTVGIIFINPQFLVGDSDADRCPDWSATDTNAQSICNKILTNKGWYIRGVDHQIKDGSYITSIKLVLPAPGAELLDAGSLVHLGGDPGGGLVPQGGQFATIDAYSLGSTAALWGYPGAGGSSDCDPELRNECDECPQFTGGGENCIVGIGDCYTFVFP